MLFGSVVVIIAIGTDHAGFPLRHAVIEAVRARGDEILDCGAHHVIPHDDYPDYAAAVAREILAKRAERGVLICGSGVGASVAANKFPGIRAALCTDTYSAHQGVEHDDMNVLCVGARVVGPSLCTDIVSAFLGARFEREERYVRRLSKIEALERGFGETASRS